MRLEIGHRRRFSRIVVGLATGRLYHRPGCECSSIRNADPDQLVTMTLDEAEERDRGPAPCC